MSMHNVCVQPSFCVHTDLSGYNVCVRVILELEKNSPLAKCIYLHSVEYTLKGYEAEPKKGDFSQA